MREMACCAGPLSNRAVVLEEDLPQSLAIGPIEVTQMLCADPISKQETAYLSRLDKAAAWRYAFGYLALTYKLEDDSLGELLFAPEKP